MKMNKAIISILVVLLSLTTVNALVSSSDVLAAYHFDVNSATEDNAEGTSTYDLTRSEAMVHGSTNCASGNCYYFDNTDERFYDETWIDIYDYRAGISFCFYEYALDASTHAMQLYSFDGTTAAGEFTVRNDATEKRDFYGGTGNPATTPNAYGYHSDFTTSYYNHLNFICVVHGGTTESFYVNGVLNATWSNSHDWSDSFDGKFYVGAYQDGSASYKGYIDELVVFDIALEQADVTFLMSVDNVYPFLAPDTTNPYWDNLENDALNSTYNDIVKFNVSLHDETLLSDFKFSHNMTGTWANVSEVSIGETDFTAEYNLTITSMLSINICGRFWFNDSSNNINLTDMSCFNSTAPDILEKLIIRKTSDKTDRIIFYDNGNAYFNGTISAYDYVTLTKPYFTSSDITYNSLTSMKLNTIDNIHKTAPTECYSMGGTSIQCLVNALIVAVQNIDARLQRIEKLLFDNKVDIENRLDEKMATLDSKLSILDINIDDVKLVMNITDAKINETKDSINDTKPPIVIK